MYGYKIEDKGVWAEICASCYEKYFKNYEISDNSLAEITCSVKGCQNEAEIYIDFVSFQEDATTKKCEKLF